MKLMRRLLSQKKYLLLIGCLSGCGDTPPASCHHFESSEKQQLKQQIKQVPAGTPLDGLIINYEDICAA